MAAAAYQSCGTAGGAERVQSSHVIGAFRACHPRAARLEYYIGVGFEVNPARHYTGAVRYLFNIDGYRPYIGAGYLFDDLYAIGTYSHNVFGEIGYSWVLHRTFIR